MTREKLASLKEDPKAFLLRKIEAEEYIREELENYMRLKALAESITRALSAAPAQSSYKQSLVENRVLDMEEILQHVRDHISVLAEAEKDVKEAIDIVQGSLKRRILRKAYLNGKELLQISSEVKKDYGYVVRLHSQAIQELQEVK